MSKHEHYHKDVSKIRSLDVYRVLSLFEVTNPCVQHAIKKLLCAGKRGAGKSYEQDIREAVDTLNRALQMIAEDSNAGPNPRMATALAEARELREQLQPKPDGPWTRWQGSNTRPVPADTVVEYETVAGTRNKERCADVCWGPLVTAYRIVNS